MIRGIVLPLTAEQRRTRMLWLAGEATVDRLDPFVKRPSIDDLPRVPGYERAQLPLKICDVFYRLNGGADGLPPFNGGKDPTALDFADRWSHPGKTFINRTADCIGGMAWCGGFDRYQVQRFSHLYGGWINTDSMIMDATGAAKCFVILPRPSRGCFVVFASGSAGHKVGHIGGVTDIPAEWDARDRGCWQALGVVDMASRGAGIPGNRRGNGLTWYAAGGVFIAPTMKA